MIKVPLKFHTELEQENLILKYSLLIDEDIEKFMITVSSHQQGRTPIHKKKIILNVLENRADE